MYEGHNGGKSEASYLDHRDSRGELDEPPEWKQCMSMVSLDFIATGYHSAIAAVDAYAYVTTLTAASPTTTNQNAIRKMVSRTGILEKVQVHLRRKGLCRKRATDSGNDLISVKLCREIFLPTLLSSQPRLRLSTSAENGYNSNVLHWRLS